MTSGGSRRRGRNLRLLYFFRTPPGVRVGRAPIDEDAIRLLEEHNPDIQFDWTRILKAPQPQPQSQEQEQNRRDARVERRREPRPAVPGSAAGFPLPAGSVQPPASDAELRALDAELPASNAELPSIAPVEPVEPIEPLEPLEPIEPLEPFEPLPPEPDIAPRYARIGAPGLMRLRARYAELMARIAEKPLEETVKEELRTTAERLNPDAWVTEEEVAAALEQYESVFETLRPVVGRHARHRRRRRV